MFSEFMDDYYRSKLGVDDICASVGCDKTTFSRWRRRNGHPSRQSYLRLIDTGIAELDAVLKTKYSSLASRCRGLSTDHYGHYRGLEYMPVNEWVEFCNENRATLVALWGTYTASGRQQRYAVSVDRIDNAHGYTRDNVQFVTHGFNSWKRSVNPITVTHDGVTSYFLNREDASLAYGLRRQAIGENPDGFTIESSTVSDVLTALSLPSLGAYYEQRLSDESKVWDTRKRWAANTRRVA